MFFKFNAKLALTFVVFLLPSVVTASPDTESLLVDRCVLNEDVPVYTRSQSVFPELKGVPDIPSINTGKPLPSLMVEGWNPIPGTLEKVLSNLGDEAGFSVKGTDFSVVSWNGKTAPLSKVISELSAQANADWSFDGSTLTIIKKPLPVDKLAATVLLPSSRDARLAFLDIVRGHGLNIKVQNGEAFIFGTKDSFSKASNALLTASQLTVFDVIFLRGRPSDGRYNWGSIGASEMSVANAGGRFAFSGMSINSVITALRNNGDVVQDSAQTVASPQGWSLAVPQVQCGSGSGELTIKPKIVGDIIDLSLYGAGVSAQYPSFKLGSVALVAASVPVEGWVQMVLVRPRIVAFKK